MIDLRNYVDPLVFWGCSSRTALEGDPLPNLFGYFMFHHSARPSVADIPSGRIRLDDLRLHGGLSAGSTCSSLPTDTGTIYALSPEPVTLEDVIAAVGDDPEQPPMFVFSEYIYVTDGMVGETHAEHSLGTQLNNRGLRLHWPRSLYKRYDLRQIDYELEHGVQYGIIASEADWTANGRSITPCLPTPKHTNSMPAPTGRTLCLSSHNTCGMKMNPGSG